MSRVARLLELERASGPENMARDEAILEAVAAGHAPPTLRLYTWRGRWLSIGMAQPIADVDRAACARAGVGVLRRPSGGTAVLHVAQLGWSLALPSDHWLALPDIVASYRQHAEITGAALAELGIAARPVEPEVARAPLPDPVLAIACFGGLAPHELIAGPTGRKLVGWGQVRRRGVVLHHAVVSRRFDPGALASLLRVDRDRLTAALADRVTSLAAEAPGRVATPAADAPHGVTTPAADAPHGVSTPAAEVPGRVTGAALAGAIAAAYARAGFDVRVGHLSADEAARAVALAHEKYAAESWTARR